MPEDGSRRRHRLRWWIVGAVALVAVVAVALPFAYIHFIEGSAPPKLALPGNTSGGGTSGASSGSVDGTWNVGTGSVVGYRVDEVLVGQHATAVGRGTEVSGSIVISGATVTEGSFAVAMGSVVSDQSQRNAQFDGPIMDVSKYPTSTLRITGPIALHTIPALAATAEYPAAGNLTLRGVTKPVTFTVSAERTSGGIVVLADIPIRFSTWGIANPSISGFVTTSDSGTLEALLHFTQGAGNPAVGTGPGSRSGGAHGGPPSAVTVPPTTVPPLTIPTNG